jgi:pimeloyl-ACP methyl ester carboxylesterase
MYDSVRSGIPDPGLAGAIESAHAEPWFPSSALPYPFPSTPVAAGERLFLLFEPAPMWKSVSVPVLALWGGKDASVPAATSREIVESALQAGHNPDHTLVLYPTADHALRIVREKDSAWDFPRSVPGARLFIAEWLREHVPLPRPGRPGVSEWTPS